MTLSNKSIKYIMPKCSLQDAELQIRFAHQYELIELEKILIDWCCDSQNKFGKFDDCNMIRVGETYSSQKLIELGIGMFDIENKEKTMKYISECKNKAVKLGLISKIYTLLEKFRDMMKNSQKRTN